MRQPLGRNRDPETLTEADVRLWLERMLVACPDQVSAQLYKTQARKLGWRLLAYLVRFRVKVEILSHGDYRRGRKHNTSGTYCAGYRTISLDAAALDQPHSCLVHHEMGHALDHLISNQCMGKNDLRCSSMLWHGLSHQRKSFVTAYAATNPCEYFAESVEAYFQPHQRIWMEHNDPGMAAFVKALIELSDM